MTKVWRGASLVAALGMLAVPFGSARADLILAARQTTSGTGIGAVNTILTIQSSGNATVETGCVGFGGAIGSVFNTAGMCTGAASDVKTGASQTQIRTLGQVGVSTASEFGIVLNAAEPAGNSITVDALVVSFFSPTGTLLFQGSLRTPVTLPNTATGTGNSGFVFMLDAVQQAQATAAGAFRNQGNFIGLSAQLSNATGGNETFFVASFGATPPPVSPIPEPATVVLMGTGLLGVFGAVRRRRKTA